MVKENDAATDLWAQMFERAAADPWATVMDPEYDETADRAKFVAGMAAAGWKDNEIKCLEEQMRARQVAAPVTSPGVNREVEAIMAKVADDVEAAMGRLKLNSHAKVARGIEPHGGRMAAKIGVIMTEESIVTISSFLSRFCGLIARAFARTLRLAPMVWARDDYIRSSGTALLRSSPSLVLYWFQIFWSFAMTGTHISVPFRPSTREEVLLMEQIARGMEMFAVAHEYSHHHLAHGRNIEADARAEEFAADQLALRICDEADREPVIIPNPYLVSGAGGAILLMALETLRSTEELVGAPFLQTETHPTASDRIRRFDSVRLLQPEAFRALKSFRVASGRIMEVVHEEIVPALAAFSPAYLKEMQRVREQTRGPAQYS